MSPTAFVATGAFGGDLMVPIVSIVVRYWGSLLGSLIINIKLVKPKKGLHGDYR